MKQKKKNVNQKFKMKCNKKLWNKNLKTTKHNKVEKRNNGTRKLEPQTESYLTRILKQQESSTLLKNTKKWS